MTVNTVNLALIEVEHTYHDNEAYNQMDVIQIRSEFYHRPSTRGGGRVWCQEELGHRFDSVIVSQEMAENLKIKPCERGCWTMENENELMHDYTVTIPSVRIQLRHPEEKYEEADELVEKFMPQIEEATDKAMEAFNNLLKEIHPALSVKHNL